MGHGSGPSGAAEQEHRLQGSPVSALLASRPPPPPFVHWPLRQICGAQSSSHHPDGVTHPSAAFPCLLCSMRPFELLCLQETHEKALRAFQRLSPPGDPVAPAPRSQDHCSPKPASRRKCWGEKRRELPPRPLTATADQQSHQARMTVLGSPKRGVPRW